MTFDVSTDDSHLREPEGSFTPMTCGAVAWTSIPRRILWGTVSHPEGGGCSGRL